MKRLILFSLIFTFSYALIAQNLTSDSLFKADDQQAEKLYNEGVTLFQDKHYADAMAKFTEAIGLKNNFEKAYFNRASVKMETGDFAGAEQDFTSSVNLSPSAKAYFGRGKSKYERNLADEAIADFSKTVESDSNYAQAYYYRGVLQFQKKEYEKAVKDTESTKKVERSLAAFSGIFTVLDNVVNESDEIHKKLATMKEFAIAAGSRESYDAAVKAEKKHLKDFWVNATKPADESELQKSAETAKKELSVRQKAYDEAMKPDAIGKEGKRITEEEKKVATSLRDQAEEASFGAEARLEVNKMKSSHSKVFSAAIEKTISTIIDGGTIDDESTKLLTDFINNPKLKADDPQIKLIQSLVQTARYLNIGSKKESRAINTAVTQDLLEPGRVEDIQKSAKGEMTLDNQIASAKRDRDIIYKQNLIKEDIPLSTSRAGYRESLIDHWVD